jgi:hypothetical protein
MSNGDAQQLYVAIPITLFESESPLSQHDQNLDEAAVHDSQDIKVVCPTPIIPLHPSQAPSPPQRLRAASSHL